MPGKSKQKTTQVKLLNRLSAGLLATVIFLISWLFYDRSIGFYGVAELIKNPVKISEKDIIAAARSSEKINVDMPLTGATF